MRSHRSSFAPTPAEVGVRPYLLTRGRTRANRAIAVEALVETTDRGRAARYQLRFEEQAITVACETVASLAEVAAVARIPIGVARVLVADLTEQGIVCVYEAPARVADDVELIARLIRGVRAL